MLLKWTPTPRIVPRASRSFRYFGHEWAGRRLIRRHARGCDAVVAVVASLGGYLFTVEVGGEKAQIAAWRDGAARLIRGTWTPRCGAAQSSGGGGCRSDQSAASEE